MHLKHQREVFTRLGICYNCLFIFKRTECSSSKPWAVPMLQDSREQLVSLSSMPSAIPQLWWSQHDKGMWPWLKHQQQTSTSSVICSRKLRGLYHQLLPDGASYLYVPGFGVESYFKTLVGIWRNQFFTTKFPSQLCQEYKTFCLSLFLPLFLPPSLSPSQMWDFQYAVNIIGNKGPALGQ